MAIHDMPLEDIITHIATKCPESLLLLLALRRRYEADYAFLGRVSRLGGLL